uniref:Uncharacterized protein n=1 Tax=Heterorhabditis bacteriophora TaxID=37862 RepID=A0A1I7W8E9_HETBA
MKLLKQWNLPEKMEWDVCWAASLGFAGNGRSQHNPGTQQKMIVDRIEIKHPSSGKKQRTIFKLIRKYFFFKPININDENKNAKENTEWAFPSASGQPLSTQSKSALDKQSAVDDGESGECENNSQ